MKLSGSSSRHKSTFTGAPSKHSAFSKPTQTKASAACGNGKGEKMNVTEHTMPQKAAHIEHTSAQKAALTAHGFSTQPSNHNNKRQGRPSKRTPANVRENTS